MLDLSRFARAIPKAELHLHLEGAVQADTFAKLARKNGIALPGGKSARELYDYDNLVDFLEVYDLVSRSVVTADDFHLITYEALADCARSGGRYAEFFFSPIIHLVSGVTYPTMLSGILRAMDDVETEFGLVSRVIPAHNRELSVERGLELLDLILAHRDERVIGIGLDYDEEPFPPAPFKPLYDRAGKAGLRLTAHAGEGGPAKNVEDALDVLGCERIDHGYRVMENPALVARCAAERIFFTVCPSSCEILTPWRDLAARDHPIRQMMDAGIPVVIDTDDPPMLRTNLAKEYRLVGERIGVGAGGLKALALNSLEAAWLDDSVKRSWRAEWSAEIDRLTAEEAAGRA
jgi:adenosine deaminase